MNRYTQHADVKDIERNLFTRRERRCEAALNYLLALVIGCCLAGALVAWWSA